MDVDYYIYSTWTFNTTPFFSDQKEGFPIVDLPCNQRNGANNYFSTAGLFWKKH